MAILRKELETHTACSVGGVYKLIGYEHSSDYGLLLIRSRDYQGSVWKLFGREGHLERLKLSSPVEPWPVHTVSSEKGEVLGLSRMLKLGAGVNWEIVRVRDRHVIQKLVTNADGAPRIACLLNDAVITVGAKTRNVSLQYFNQPDSEVLLDLDALTTSTVRSKQ